ncbi:YeeE/YedE family protein [Candidatus Nitrosacidococcus sp. I8]|uniref:YeeE/YedE family protein n=1 Tax=Candidatus Nitrosacidococcus sp. I8 TaxID=2942908 RepID=UPI0022275D95|nr:YeeE/YedE family protein [Candidatus Nitrosacidococcus sp. I8]CAH9018422.1 hypothetical protein NURINAE_00914 [Candidatus Nitrosacidococcus sp. I8]
MIIDWNAFTPWTALGGGILIGIAAGMFLFFNGRIAGISGIVGGLLTPTRYDFAWRIAFISGLIVSPLLLSYTGFILININIDAGYIALITAGLLVGIGTRLGSGCTSGHGVCGLSRLSPRSLVATLTFMIAGFATVYFIRHILT